MNMKKHLLRALVIGLTLFVGAITLAVVFGGPSAPAVMSSVNDPFRAVDYSGLPKLEYYPARDGESLAFRRYSAAQGESRGSAVLLHGSSADSRSMHVLAKALSAAGLEVHSLDVRGHGSSGEKGDIAYVGQLEHDLQDFVAAVKPAAPVTLIGFSSGGGFALRVAGSERADLFDRYVLLAPFISQDAPTYRANSGGWVKVGVPRYVALSILNQLGIHRFNHLPVISYALSDDARQLLTPEYSFNLAQNYRPQADYSEDVRHLRQPTRVLVGEQDEMFQAQRFDEVFRAANQPVPVTIVDGVNHIGLTLKPTAISAVVDALAQGE